MLKKFYQNEPCMKTKKVRKYTILSFVFLKLPTFNKQNKIFTVLSISI